MKPINRRTFLKATTIGAVAIVTPTASALAKVAGPSTCPPGTTESIKIYDTELVGGNGGELFADLGGDGLQIELPANARVQSVIINSGNYIDGIQLEWTVDGITRFANHHGGDGGGLSVFRLDPNEYITSMSGVSGAFLDSLIITTNKRSSPRYGGDGGGNFYSLNIPEGYHLIGFSGRAGYYIDAIGMRYRPGC